MKRCATVATALTNANVKPVATVVNTVSANVMLEVWHYLSPTEAPYCPCAVQEVCWEHNPSWTIPNHLFEDTEDFCSSWTEIICGKIHELVKLTIIVDNNILN